MSDVAICLSTCDVSFVAVPLEGAVFAERLSVVAGVGIVCQRASARHVVGPALSNRRHDRVVRQWRHLVNATKLVHRFDAVVHKRTIHYYKRRLHPAADDEVLCCDEYGSLSVCLSVCPLA